MIVPCSCGKRLQVPDTLAGKKVKCPACGKGVMAEAMGIQTTKNASPPPRTAPEPAPAAPARKSWMLLALTGLLGAFTALNIVLTGVFLFLGIRSSANARTPTPVAARQTPEKPETPVPPKGDPKPPKPPPDQPPPVVPPKVGQIDCIVDVEAVALNVSPDGRRVLAIGNTSIGLYDLEKGTLITSLPPDKRRAWTAAFLPDSRQCLVSWEDDNDNGTLEIIDMEGGKRGRVIDGKTNMPRFVAVTRDGKRAFTAGYPGRVAHEWDLTEGKLKQNSVAVPNQCGIAIPCDDGSRVLVGSPGGVSLWEPAKGAALTPFGQEQVRGHAISGDGKRALLGTLTQVLVWDIDGNREIARFESGHRVQSAVFSPDTRRVLVGCASIPTAKGQPSKSFVFLFDAATGRKIHAFDEHDGYMWAVAFTPDGKKGVSIANNKTMRIWQLPE